jgi:pimeloyl-ACP methyl ester carboxylesterase
VAREYRDVFTSAHLVAVPNAAHMTWLEQPDLVQRVVAAFLLDKELPTSADGRDAEEPRK